MHLLLFFGIILILVKLFQLHTRSSILIALVITYIWYRDGNQTPEMVLTGLSNTVLGKSDVPNRDDIAFDKDIPDIYSQEWLHFWKDFLLDIKQHNPENYFDVMKSLKYFHQTYNQIYNGLNMPQQHLQNMSLLQKEMLNMLHSTVHNLPVTQNEVLDNTLQKKISHFQKELDFRLEDLRNFVNKDWNNGNINNKMTPVYTNDLSTIPHDYSPNYSFY